MLCSWGIENVPFRPIEMRPEHGAVIREVVSPRMVRDVDNLVSRWIKRSYYLGRLAIGTLNTVIWYSFNQAGVVYATPLPYHLFKGFFLTPSCRVDAGIVRPHREAPLG